MKNLLIICLLVSLLVNIFLFNEKNKSDQKIKLLSQKNVYSQAQKDIEDFFEPKEEQKKELVKDKNIKVEQKNEVTLKTYVRYGVFSTEHFLNKNVEKFKNQGLPLSLKESKKGTILLIGPIGKNVAKQIIEDFQTPKDAKIIYEK